MSTSIHAFPRFPRQFNAFSNVFAHCFVLLQFSTCFHAITQPTKGICKFSRYSTCFHPSLRGFSLPSVCACFFGISRSSECFYEFFTRPPSAFLRFRALPTESLCVFKLPRVSNRFHRHTSVFARLNAFPEVSALVHALRRKLLSSHSFQPALKRFHTFHILRRDSMRFYPISRSSTRTHWSPRQPTLMRAFPRASTDIHAFRRDSERSSELS